MVWGVTSTRKFSKSQKIKCLEFSKQSTLNNWSLSLETNLRRWNDKTGCKKKSCSQVDKCSDWYYESNSESFVPSANSRISSKITNHNPLVSIDTFFVHPKGVPGSYSKRFCRGRSAVGVAEKLFAPFIVRWKSETVTCDCIASVSVEEGSVVWSHVP